LPACSTIGHSCCLNRLFLLALVVLACSSSYGQESLEQIFEAACEGAESPGLYETLESLKVHPLDLNQAEYEELLAVPWITPSMARNLIEYRVKKGLLIRPGELVNVPGFSCVLVERLLPYLRTGKPRSQLKRRYRIRSRVAGHYPRREEYSASPFRIYNRINASVGDGLSMCALAEKDPYEMRYTDMFTFHTHAARDGMLRSVVAGDYWLDFAEGLVLGEARYAMKGSGVSEGSERGIVPNRSSVESGWLRGAAANLRISDVSLYCFASRKRLDASVNEEGLVTGLYAEGLHRTEGECAKIGRLGEALLGLRAALAVEFFRIGLTGFATEYDRGFASSQGSPRSFEGSSYSVVGVDLGTDVGPMELFGELAGSLSLGESYLIGLSYREKEVDLGLLFRHYDEDFYNPHSAGFGDPDNCNEEGAYLEVGFRPAKGTKVSGFMDLFRTLGPSYASVYGARGRDLRLEVKQRLGGRLSLTGRMYASGTDKFHEGEGFYFEERSGFRIQGEYTPSRRGMLRARFESVRASSEADSTADRGFMMYWEVALQPAMWARLRGRFSVFETDSWDARLYQHESDLPGVMRNVALSGAGAAGYLLGSVKPVPWIRLSGKVSWKKKDGDVGLGFSLQSDVEIERGPK
jgi:hypothetical protein